MASSPLPYFRVLLKMSPSVSKCLQFVSSSGREVKVAKHTPLGHGKHARLGVLFLCDIIEKLRMFTPIR